MEALKIRIRHVPDFPKPGILFYDITTLLRDAEGFKLAVDALASQYRPATPMWSSASRAGGSSSARQWPTGWASASCRCARWGSFRRGPSASPTIWNTAPTASRCITMRSSREQRVLIIDDLLATGGTARATVDLIRQLGGTIVGIAVLIELVALNGRQRLEGEPSVFRAQVLRAEILVALPSRWLWAPARMPGGSAPSCSGLQGVAARTAGAARGCRRALAVAQPSSASG